MLDKFQLAIPARGIFPVEPERGEPGSAEVKAETRELQLESVIRALSTTSSLRPLLKRSRLRSLLSQIVEDKGGNISTQTQPVAEHTDLEWFATAKATIQTYGLILNSLLEQTIPLSESLWYWDDVLGSYANTGLYTAQTTPARFWTQAKEVYHDAREKWAANADIRASARHATLTLTGRWREFYVLVQNSIRERSLAQASARILSPFALGRMEARRKQSNVKKLRERNATAIGLLVDEGLSFQPFEEDFKSDKSGASPTLRQAEWQSTIAKSVSLLENILRHAGTIDNTLAEFEDSIFASVEGDPDFVSVSEASETTATPAKLAHRLIQMLDDYLPEQERASHAMAVEYGKPSRLVRYWIPVLTLLLSGSTILRFLTNRRAAITQWIRDLGSTTVDFWRNWVIEPTMKLIRTIRHDEQSEIAIQSRDSLKVDRESLERMVVDFALQHPENGQSYSESQVVEIKAKVKEGDLTPVLRAYEREMQNPIKNAIMGDLVRTALIQVQKTKVDVEVAIAGIDSILKSQELLFGFVGIAPGVLISYAAIQWLRGVFGSRRGLRQTKKRGQTVRVLRYVDKSWPRCSRYADELQDDRPDTEQFESDGTRHAVLQRPRPPAVRSSCAETEGGPGAARKRTARVPGGPPRSHGHQNGHRPADQSRPTHTLGVCSMVAIEGRVAGGHVRSDVANVYRCEEVSRRARRAKDRLLLSRSQQEWEKP